LEFDVIANEIDMLIEVEHVFVELDHAQLHRLAIDVMNLFQVVFDDERWIGQHVKDERCFCVALVGFNPKVARW
jgi:RNAse (barnase) inhibitor barstar